jgi:hypothetical protein
LIDKSIPLVSSSNSRAPSLGADGSHLSQAGGFSRRVSSGVANTGETHSTGDHSPAASAKPSLMLGSSVAGYRRCNPSEYLRGRFRH